MKEYVWYAGYGSNLFRERFLCYIQGGTPEGSLKKEKGCRDRSLPVREDAVTLPFEFYFAGKSSKWNGGMGFIVPQRNENASTLAKAYLITKEQFCDVVMQENGMTVPPQLDFDRCVSNGNLVFRDGTYGNLIYVGNKNGFPMFTFTNERSLDSTKPSIPYLKKIAVGLILTHKMKPDQITNYLLEKRGVAENYDKESLAEIFN